LTLDLNPAPAILALEQITDNAGFGAQQNTGAIVRPPANVADLALDHDRSLSRKQPRRNPAFSAFEVFDFSPIIELGNDL
jgi:hypothetical protein